MDNYLLLTDFVRAISLRAASCTEYMKHARNIMNIKSLNKSLAMLSLLWPGSTSVRPKEKIW